MVSRGPLQYSTAGGLNVGKVFDKLMLLSAEADVIMSNER